MSHDLHSRAIIPSSLGACEIENPEWLIKYLHNHDQEWWVRYFVAKLARDQTDHDLLLAIILGDDLP
jgi:hypothetical protein